MTREVTERAREHLLAQRGSAGHWTGELSSSALSTATAACAVELVRRHGGEAAENLARHGIAWLLAHQNGDGGYGDTADSPSNVSTTALCWAALGMRAEGAEAFARAEAWLKREVGDLSAPSLVSALSGKYGEDRTFAVPILTMCALAGRLGADPWRHIPSLPFELAALPASWFRVLNLRVVSYALPALIAIGQAHHHHRRSLNPFRAIAKKRTLRILEAIQPASGGFLEAAPLTSFVTMSLASIGHADHPVARKGIAFLAETVRPDGSWPIDTNLATWVTTLSVQALGGDVPDRGKILDWLLAQQLKEVHPYTRAAPGGWAWTDRTGGVPDADDTPGALLALRLLGDGRPEVVEAARKGVEWLLDLQNGDGGIPTFCRGWGKLPFDRSCPDLTAHALRAWDAWRPDLPDLAPRLDGAAKRAAAHLVDVQRDDGAWVPLWFGNQRAPGQENPLYGTAKVLLCAPLDTAGEAWRRALERGRAWLLSAQNGDGGWGGAPGLPPTVEETALAVEALAGHEAAAKGAAWLAKATEGGTRFPAAPIGLYFAKLWYSEKLYPVIFSVAALRRLGQNPGTP